jgi:hypothetical protein
MRQPRRQVGRAPEANKSESREYGRQAPVQRKPISSTSISELMLWWTPPALKPISRLFRLNHIPANNAARVSSPSANASPVVIMPKTNRAPKTAGALQHYRHHHVGVGLLRIGAGEASDHFLKTLCSGDAAQKVTSAHVYENGTGSQANQCQPAAGSRETVQNVQASSAIKHGSVRKHAYRRRGGLQKRCDLAAVIGQRQL